jgi:DNA-binding NarL/FixJ family response regulator
MSITVFLADDHGVVREGLRMLLETEQDIKVVGSADNGKDAVNLIKDLKPDIAIIDIAMPGLNGIEVTAQVREKSTATKCIILSMHSTSEHIFRSFKAGARGYLLKESAGSEVVDAVRSVYSGRRYVCQKISDVMIDSNIREQEGQPGQKSPLERLSAREREILQLVAEGKSSAAIAAILLISQKTVETYRSRLMTKLGIHDIPSLVRFAIKHGIVGEM